MISHITQLEFSSKQIVLHRGIVNNIRQRTKALTAFMSISGRMMLMAMDTMRISNDFD